MKRYTWILTAVMAASLLLVGCAKKGGVDTGKLESSFQSSEPGTKGKVDSAVSAIKSSDYAGAMASLQSMASDAKLTPEQQQAIKDVVEQLKTLITGTANQAADGAKKALGDLQKSLPK